MSITATVMVVGTKYRPVDVAAAFPNGEPQAAEVVCDPGNEFHRDPESHAHKVMVNGLHIGFIPSNLCKWWHEHESMTTVKYARRSGNKVTLLVETDLFIPSTSYAVL